MVYWNTKPPPGPLSKTANAVLIVLGAIMTIPILAGIVAWSIWLGGRVINWFAGR